MTTITWIILTVLMLAMTTLMVIGYVRLEKPLSHFAATGLQGVCALGLLNGLGGVTGISLGFGWLPIGVSFFLGIPGVIGLVSVSTILGL